ncbi:hypothetical protein GE09DRAFT_356423 [Coniochaeta sp. 2T2.1]|nr:hypothetical protein GE09DRAFT_356423 [Coniochaeta sp. 2T2.1]
MLMLMLMLLQLLRPAKYIGGGWGLYFSFVWQAAWTRRVAKNNVIQLNQPFCFKHRNGHSAGAGSLRVSISDRGLLGQRHRKSRKPHACVPAYSGHPQDSFSSLPRCCLQTRDGALHSRLTSSKRKRTSCPTMEHHTEPLACQEMLVRSNLASTQSWPHEKDLFR